MERPTIRFTNNDQAAHAVYKYVKANRLLQRHLTLRPFNYAAPKFTEWWLIPSTDWPAYHHSKLCFDQWGSDIVLTGFFSEKGLGDQLTGMVKPSLIIEPGWYWHELLGEVQEGKLAEPMRAVLDRSGLPLLVYLSLYEFNNVPDFETGQTKPNDRLTFVADDDDLHFHQTVEAAGVLAPLNGARDLRDLSARIADLGDISWYWVNFMIGVCLSYRGDDPGEWGAPDIWKRALEPWVPCVW
jgi:hypothetical protein